MKLNLRVAPGETEPTLEILRIGFDTDREAGLVLGATGAARILNVPEQLSVDKPFYGLTQSNDQNTYVLAERLKALEAAALVQVLGPRAKGDEEAFLDTKDTNTFYKILCWVVNTGLGPDNEQKASDVSNPPLFLCAMQGSKMWFDAIARGMQLGLDAGIGLLEDTLPTVPKHIISNTFEDGSRAANLICRQSVTCKLL